MTDITLICLSLLMAILTMMVAAEMGHRRGAGIKLMAPDLGDLGDWAEIGGRALWGAAPSYIGYASTVLIFG